jgi:hypothetical protein
VRSIVFLGFLALFGCDQGSRAAPQVAITGECTPMPAECPERLACDVTTVEEDGEEVRVCGGTSCCQSFCEQNGCTKCCATPAPALP